MAEAEANPTLSIGMFFQVLDTGLIRISVTDGKSLTEVDLDETGVVALIQNARLALGMVKGADRLVRN